MSLQNLMQSHGKMVVRKPSDKLRHCILRGPLRGRLKMTARTMMRRLFLDTCPHFSYQQTSNLAREGRFLDAILKVERVRFLRAVSQSALGRLGYRPLRHYDRGARCLA